MKEPRKRTDVTIREVVLHFLEAPLRVPLKFGAETVTKATLARVRIEVENACGEIAQGWGETPLSVSWVWPCSLAYEVREKILKDFCVELAEAWAEFPVSGHPMEIGSDFLAQALPALLRENNAARKEPMPWLAALVCCSPFDLALHDAFGVANDVPTYEIYNARFMNRDLAELYGTEDAALFSGRYPQDFFQPRRDRLPAWHLVGGRDPLRETDLTGDEPADGVPVLLRDWIRADGLRCLKIKLRGNDAKWDTARLVDVGTLAREEGVDWLTADFNCTVAQPAYVNGILDHLLNEHPWIYGMILYIEQPFPYELEEHPIDVRSVSARKPLFLDESAHDWRQVKLGHKLGWTGVALKTCKTQTGALLSLCWARAHEMLIMVQDLTNPSLAQISHLLLAAHAGTIMGVETNAMQFYPALSRAEARIHPGAFHRRAGLVDLQTVAGSGFGYRIREIGRVLPEPQITAGKNSRPNRSAVHS